MAAKNHAAIMPDANKEATLNSLVGAAFGAAGQRCMALSTAVFIGESKEWYDLPPPFLLVRVVCSVTRPLELGSRASSLSTLVVDDRKSRHTSTLAVADGVFQSH